ncbi:E2F-associated phosphoprotein-like [Chenopodium quinoa]|uniref:E2F-associated phosphoprotein-like n=1 Tax=Chenopodium quinoa TaxID=63459 RepID=UPI000B77BD5B|nr:E2F-associated phosphoprotein-like [Chenopodium quinoa]
MAGEERESNMGEPMECVASPNNSQQTVSDDDEIDYSIKPEFYDSDLDDKDELWVARKRKGPRTDAVLSCPACFTTLCLECQRHDIYLTQYRAMFVTNCVITAKMVFPQGSKKRRKYRKAREPVEAEEASSTSVEAVRQVCCSVCSTEVGVIDKDEVYHFYDVLPSES